MSELFTINSKVQAALEKMFREYRIIFWYDNKAELTALFNDLKLPEIEKLVIENNEFTLKYRMVIEQPNQRFLVYQPKPRPIWCCRAAKYL